MPSFFASLVSDPLTNGEFNRKWKLLPCSVACESPRPVRRRSPRSQPQLFDGALLLLWKAVSDLSFCLRHWGPLPSSTSWKLWPSQWLYISTPQSASHFQLLPVCFDPSLCDSLLSFEVAKLIFLASLPLQLPARCRPLRIWAGMERSTR